MPPALVAIPLRVTQASGRHLFSGSTQQPDRETDVKKIAKRLTLKAETVAVLSGGALRRAFGGAPYTQSFVDSACWPDPTGGIIYRTDACPAGTAGCQPPGTFNTCFQGTCQTIVSQ